MNIVEEGQSSRISVFYDLTHRKVLYKSLDRLSVLKVDDPDFLQVFLLRSSSASPICMNWLSAAISPDNKFLAFHTPESAVQLLSLETMNLEVLKIKKKETVLGYHWGDCNSSADFALVTSYGIQMWKLRPEQGKFRKVMSSRFSVRQYWLEPKNLMFMLQDATKPQLMNTFGFYQATDTNSFAGLKYRLSVTLPSNVKLSNQLPNSSNLTLSPRVNPDVYQCVLTAVYDSIYFLQFQPCDGTLQRYRLTTNNRLLVPVVISLHPGPHAFFTVNNLLVVHSILGKEVKLFDFKGKLEFDTPFYTTKLPDSTIDVASSEDNQGLFWKCGVPSLDQVSKETKQHLSLSFPEAVLPAALLQVDHDVMLDSLDGVISKMSLKTTDLMTAFDSPKDKLLFLLRRSGCKREALSLLRNLVLSHISLTVLSDIFMSINTIYHQAAVENMASLQEKTASRDSELKCGDGLTVLLQIDIYEFVLLDLFESKSADVRYTTAVFSEYIRSLHIQSISVTLNVQILVVKHLTQTGNFDLLQEAMISRTISDSKEISHILISAGHPLHPQYSPEAEQLAFDMLRRIGDSTECVRFLLDRKRVYEALVCAEEAKNKGECLDLIETYGNGQTDPEVALVIFECVSEFQGRVESRRTSKTFNSH